MSSIDPYINKDLGERAIARHEVREIEQRHTQDGLRERDSSASSLSEGQDDIVIIYNRVPKTASTSFTHIAYDCAGRTTTTSCTSHHQEHPVMSIQDQVRFVKNVTEWREMKPAFYHGHVSFLDFTKFGVKRKPIYINVIRDPIERLTFDECVSAGGSDCAPRSSGSRFPFSVVTTLNAG
ncbi:hypothetical protein FQN60_002560, partial [Etheostoma spectabile]